MAKKRTEQEKFDEAKGRALSALYDMQAEASKMQNDDLVKAVASIVSVVKGTP